jgi:ABC-2 type transport system permease protein
MGSLPSALDFPASILVWGMVFFLLGFGVYASFMAGVGALVQRPQEDTQARWLVSAPVVVAYVVGYASMASDPHGVLMTVISIFPLTAPIGMVPRLVAGGVPVWQPWVAAGLTLVTIPLILRGVARIFHAQVLLSGEPFSAGRFFATLIGKT